MQTIEPQDDLIVEVTCGLEVQACFTIRIGRAEWSRKTFAERLAVFDQAIATAQREMDEADDLTPPLTADLDLVLLGPDPAKPFEVHDPQASDAAVNCNDNGPLLETNTHIVSYHVFDGQKWLADDERSWTADFDQSAAFTDAGLAQDIARREVGETQPTYVMSVVAQP